MDSAYEWSAQLFEGEGAPGTLLRLTDEQIVTLKALEMQISLGPCHKNSSPPDSSHQAVWAKWSSLGNLPVETCKKDFVDLVVSSLPVGAELTKQAQSPSNAGLSDLDREKLKQRINLAQKLARVHATGGIETAGEVLGSSYVMPDPEGEPFEKVSRAASDDDEFGEAEISALASSQTHFAPEIPAESPRFMFRSSSIPIHDHQFQEPSPLQAQDSQNDLVEEEFARSLRAGSMAQQIEELSKFTGNSMTRLETLEKELAQLREELVEKDKQTYWAILALSLLTVPSCFFVFWSLVRKSH